MKKYILGAVLSLGILISPAFTHAAGMGLTTEQASSLINVVQSAPGVPASVFVPLITSFSNITEAQASSLIVVVQSAPNAPASAFVNLLISFSGGAVATTVTTQTTQPVYSGEPAVSSAQSIYFKFTERNSSASVSAQLSVRDANGNPVNPVYTPLSDGGFAPYFALSAGNYTATLNANEYNSNGSGGSHTTLRAQFYTDGNAYSINGDTITIDGKLESEMAGWIIKGFVSGSKVKVTGSRYNGNFDAEVTLTNANGNIVNPSYSVLPGYKLPAGKYIATISARENSSSSYESATYSVEANSAGYLVTEGTQTTTQPAPVPTTQSSTVSEQVKCVFNGATTEQKCWGNPPPTTTGGSPVQFSCSGVGACVTTVKGQQGTPMTWGSSCGGSADTTIDGNNEYANFSCGGTSSGITVTAPNGGEVLQKGILKTITWKSTAGISGVYIKLRKGNDTYSGSEGQVSGVISNTGSYQWSIPTTLPNGSDYRIRVIAYTLGGENYASFDDSDASFTITSATTPAPTITSVTQDVNNNYAITIRGTNFDPTRNELKVNGVAHSFGGSAVGDGTTFLIVDYGLNGNLQFQIVNANGNSNAMSAFIVSPPTTTPAVTLTANPSSGALTLSGSPTLWVETNVSGYVPQSGETVDFGDGSRYALGYTTSTNNRHDYHTPGIYTVKLMNGTQVIASTQVTVTSAITPTPTLTLTANQTSVSYGGQTTLTWSSNATSCKFTEGDNQFTSYENTISGINRYTQSLYASQRYTIVCTGSGGSVTKSVTITVSPTTASAPTLEFSITPSVVNAGERFAFIWSSKYADSCNLSLSKDGGVSQKQSVGTSGNEGGSPSENDIGSYAFTMNCTGPGGSVSKSATLTVNPVTTTPAPMSVELQSVVIDNNGVAVTYNKNFETCAHLLNQNSQILHTQNYFCGQGANRIVVPSSSDLSAKVQVGQQVKLCHGNNYSICSGLVTVNSGPSAYNYSQSQTASVLNAFNNATNDSSTPTGTGFNYVWNNNLEIGSPYFADVSALQTALTKEGVYAGNITGGFYNQTSAAVQSFQQKYGIDSTGFVGPVTRSKLNELY